MVDARPFCNHQIECQVRIMVTASSYYAFACMHTRRQSARQIILVLISTHPPPTVHPFPSPRPPPLGPLVAPMGVVVYGATTPPRPLHTVSWCGGACIKCLASFALEWSLALSRPASHSHFACRTDHIASLGSLCIRSPRKPSKSH